MATMISLRRNYTPGGVKMWNRGLMPEYVAYRNRVDADGGDIDSGSLTRKLLKFYKSEGRLSNIKLLWSAVGGTLVQSGTNPVQISKAYSADSLTTHNDLTQATSLSQPYGVGQIQGLPMGLYNPNGGIRYMAHPEISFAADQEWCITIVFNYNGSSPASNVFFLGKSGATSIGIWFDGSIVFYSGGGRFSTKKTNNFIGKNTILSFVCNGTSTLKLYANGEYWDSITVSVNSFITDTLFYISTYSGSISHVCLNQFASITASQVAAEHAMLRSIYPEIPSVVIGSQEWAVDNFRAVATPMGDVIPNVTDNAAWAALTTPAWCSYNNDPANDAVYGKLYNWYAVKLLQDDIDAYNAANPSNPWGWRVPTKADFNTLVTTLGGVDVAGGKMKITGTDYWQSPNTGATNESGFTALGGGVRVGSGNFAELKTNTRIATSDNNAVITYYKLYYNTTEMNPIDVAKTTGMTIRLIKA